MNEWTTRPRKSSKPLPRKSRQYAALLDLAGNAIVVPQQLREHLENAGWDKTQIAEFVHRRARIFRREWAEVGKGAVVRPRRQRICSDGKPGSAVGDCGGRSSRRVWRGHPALARR
jgi:hypothetical protein